MKLNKDIVNRLVKAMFYNSNFDFSIENFDGLFFDLGIGENIINFAVEYDEQQLFNVYVYTKAENYTFVGTYDLIDNRFDRESNFFETLFFEML